MRCARNWVVLPNLNVGGTSKSQCVLVGLSRRPVHLQEYSDWPTYPQLYVDGELLGGSDIIEEMQASGELASTLQEAVKTGTAALTCHVCRPLQCESLNHCAAVQCISNHLTWTTSSWDFCSVSRVPRVELSPRQTVAIVEG